MNDFLTSLRPQVHGLTRIAIGILFWSHGAQKLLGWFGGVGPDGGTVELMSRFGVAGVLEFFGGLAIILGAFTQPVAFILAGQMAVAYFLQHVGGGGGLWWWANGGEKVAFFSWFFLLLSTMGAGG